MNTNIECESCRTVFTEEDAGTRSDMSDDMYDRPSTPITYLVCPSCGHDDISDTDREVTR
jgi:ribosomal protein S27E